jgi:predicted TIM-barrel fold metal-dependent hydrolase
MSVSVEAPEVGRQKRKTLIIDCDIHEDVHSVDEIRPYLAKEFRHYLHGPLTFAGQILHPYHKAARQDAIRDDGSLDSGYLDSVRSKHLDEHGITYGILTGLWNVCIGAMPQAQLASALASAYNSWIIDEWLEKEPRLKGSITVAPQLPQAAADEIDRVGGHPSMVQVCLPVSSPDLPYGHEFFHPIWEACVRNDVRVALHVASAGGLYGTANAAGHARSYLEIRSAYPNIFEAQLISIVANGVFEKFPELRVALIEGGFSWAPAVMWRMDQTWRSMRSEAPWLKRRPSDYIRDNVRWSTQPFEEPDDPKQLLQLIDMMGSEDLLMFATDYPHWDFDAPSRALPSVIGEDLRKKIFWQNASDFYGISAPAA